MVRTGSLRRGCGDLPGPLGVVGGRSSRTLGPVENAASVFELVRTLELDVELGDEPVVLRLEIFAARDRTGVYRARLWRQDVFRLRRSFPRDAGDEPIEQTDDTVYVEWPELLEGEYEELSASSIDDAETIVRADLQRALTAASWAV